MAAMVTMMAMIAIIEMMSIDAFTPNDQQH